MESGDPHGEWVKFTQWTERSKLGAAIADTFTPSRLRQRKKFFRTVRKLAPLLYLQFLYFPEMQAELEARFADAQDAEGRVRYIDLLHMELFLGATQGWCTYERLARRVVRVWHMCMTCHVVDVDLKVCSGCEKARYCSRLCQAADRAEHKAECVKEK